MDNNLFSYSLTLFFFNATKVQVLRGLKSANFDNDKYLFILYQYLFLFFQKSILYLSRKNPLNNIKTHLLHAAIEQTTTLFIRRNT